MLRTFGGGATLTQHRPHRTQFSGVLSALKTSEGEPVSGLTHVARPSATARACSRNRISFVISALIP